MQTFSIFGIIGITASSLLALSTYTAGSASAKPQPESRATTQACLGDFNTMLTCPAGAELDGTECRAVSKHWAKSTRQGPALFLRDPAERDSARVRVSFATNYKDHKKTGRTFRFDAEGRLESFSDLAADANHGIDVVCRPDGRVERVAYFNRGKVVGLSRTWNERDGALELAYQYDGQGQGRRVEVSAQLARRPDELCRPARCDVAAKPDLSGIPAGTAK